MLVVGIDENGLGPLLGPLVVTAAAFETPIYDRAALWRIADEFLPADDSKKIFSTKRLDRAERATLAWLAAFGHKPSTYAELADAVCAPEPPGLACDGEIPSHCRPSLNRLPFFSKAPQKLEPASNDVSAAFEKIRPAAVRSISVCPGAFNRTLKDGETNKLKLDFALMMRLAVELTSHRAEDALILSGKVGSTRSYGEWLKSQGFRIDRVEEETGQSSTYRVSGLGMVSFIKDADALHLPVAVASMIGKYIRELAMEDLNALLAVPGVRRASGYRDRVTADFVEKTRNRRGEIGLDDDCFTRNS